LRAALAASCNPRPTPAAKLSGRLTRLVGFILSAPTKYSVGPAKAFRLQYY
jgi:hypothetical protein